MGCKWLYKVKYLPDGQVDRYKARLVAKGFTQTEGLDFFDTFTHVVKMMTFRVILALAAMNNWSLTQLDVTNAFLHGDVFMDIHQRYQDSTTNKQRFLNQYLVRKLIKSIYGLR